MMFQIADDCVNLLMVLILILIPYFYVVNEICGCGLVLLLIDSFSCLGCV